MTSVLYPRIHARMRENNCLRLSLIAYPLGVALFPLLWALHYGHEEIGFKTWAAIFAQMVLRRLGDCAATFVRSLLLVFRLTGSLLDAMVFESTPGPAYIALANSMNMSVGVSPLKTYGGESLTQQSLGRALGPFFIR